MARKKIQEGRVFVAPISFFLKLIPKEEMPDDFRKSVFQARHMVCGYIEKKTYVNSDWFLVTLKMKNGWNYLPYDIAISYNVDLSKFHIIKNLSVANFLELKKIPKENIDRIIKNKDYD